MRPLLLRSVVTVLIFSLTLTGCWDRRELEDRDLVIAMAIDRAKKQGLDVSVQIPIPANIVGSGGSGSGGGGGQSVQVFDTEGSTLSDALTLMERKMHKAIFLGYLQLLLFGEEQARSGITDLLDITRRDPEIQRKLFPVVVKGIGKNLLTSGTQMEQIQSIYIERMIYIGSRDETLHPARLNDLLITLSTPSRRVPILNYVGLENGKYRWMGLAVFRDDRMIGTLDANESIPLLQIREKMLGQKLMVPCPKGNGKIQFTPLNVSRKIRVTQEPSIHVQMEVEGDITEKTCQQVVEKHRKAPMIEKEVEKVYEQLAYRLVKKAQKQWNLDIFQFGDYTRAYYPRIYKQLNWKKTFSQIPIHVSYKVDVRRSGSGVK